MNSISETVEQLMIQLAEGSVIEITASQGSKLGVVMSEAGNYFIMGTDWSIPSQEAMRSFLASSVLISSNIVVLSRDDALKKIDEGYYLN